LSNNPAENFVEFFQLIRENSFHTRRQ